jgi:hypothetical protein
MKRRAHYGKVRKCGWTAPTSAQNAMRPVWAGSLSTWLNAEAHSIAQIGRRVVICQIVGSNTRERYYAEK